jgi:hypothetical protein
LPIRNFISDDAEIKLSQKNLMKIFRVKYRLDFFWLFHSIGEKPGPARIYMVAAEINDFQYRSDHNVTFQFQTQDQ